MRGKQEVTIFESIPEFFSTIASGATPIGSAGRAPDEFAIIRVMKHASKQNIEYRNKLRTIHSHREGFAIS
jgi:hypothetical protein